MTIVSFLPTNLLSARLYEDPRPRSTPMPAALPPPPAVNAPALRSRSAGTCSSARPLFATRSAYTGVSRFSRWVRSLNRSANSVCSISGICCGGTPSGSLALMSNRADGNHDGPEIWYDLRRNAIAR
jgi:hypothetical protein